MDELALLDRIRQKQPASPVVARTVAGSVV
jgi:hypothetical protein